MFSLLLTILMLLPLILAAILAAKWYYIYFWYSSRLRGVPHWGIQWPLLGSALEMLKNSKELERHTELFSEIGSDMVFCMFGFTPVLLTRDANLIKILANSKKAVFPTLLQGASCVLGEGLITSEGKKWKIQRKLLTPVFHNNVLNTNVLSFNAQADEIMKLLEAELDKEFTDVLDYVTQYATRTASCNFIGIPFEEIKESVQAYVADSLRYVDIIYIRIYNILQQFSFIYKFSKNFREEEHLLSNREQFLDEIISKRENAWKNIDTNNNNILLDRLLSCRDNNNYYTDKLVRDEIQTFLQGSIHTLPTTVACAIHFLAENPEIQRKVFEELDSLLCGKSDNILTPHDLSKMAYLQAVLQETMRIVPPVPHLAKELNDDLEFNKFKLPKGLLVMGVVAAVHKHPQYYDQPNKFKPERFLERDDANPYAYVPFGGGPRLCIGYKYSMLSMKTFLAKLLMKYQVTSVHHRVVYKPSATMGSDNGFKIQLRDRKREPLRSVVDEKFRSPS